MSKEIILITGATGCIGGRLLQDLQADGRHLRCLLRDPRQLIGPIGPNTEVIAGDLLEPETLQPALEGVSVAIYLVHSMRKGASFEALDREAARNFAKAARDAGIRRIIYLGGLGDDSVPLSNHLRSRHETGEILRKFGGEVIEFRAAIVIGAGSLSFEMIRALVERLPIMVSPRWVRIRTQPISIGDLLSYLKLAIDIQIKGSRVIEIGGADVVSYGDLIEEYARQRGLQRIMIPVPVMSQRLSGFWLGLVTPVYARVGCALIDSLQNETIVRNPQEAIPFGIKPIGMSAAIRQALSEEDREFAQTRWSGSLSRGFNPTVWTRWLGQRLVDSRAEFVPGPPSKAFRPIAALGGKNGWYSLDILWKLRGWLDGWLGGCGLRRSKNGLTLKTGDTLDFWRIESSEAPEFLRLRSEMKLPGRAWLQFEITSVPGGNLIRQTAIFDPRGVLGLLYWYGLMPVHALIFPELLKQIAHRAKIRPRAKS